MWKWFHHRFLQAVSILPDSLGYSQHFTLETTLGKGVLQVPLGAAHPLREDQLKLHSRNQAGETILNASMPLSKPFKHQQYCQGRK